MKQIFLFLFASLLLTGCSSVTYPTIAKNEPFIATVNIKETSLTFLDQQYEPLTEWDLDIPFTGALLLDDQDTILFYGKDMDSIDVFSLATGKQVDRWDVRRGIVNMKLLQDGTSIVAVNQLLNEVSFYTKKGQVENQVKVGKSPLTIVQDDQQLYVVNFDDEKVSIINLQTRKVDREFLINHSSTGALLRKAKQELWIGGHGRGAKMEENVHVYSTETGELKRTVQAPSMPVNFVETKKGIFVLSHGMNVLYKMGKDYQIINKTMVGANPFDMIPFASDLLIAGYDSDQLYVINPDTLQIKKTIKVGKGPFQMISRE